MRLHVIQHVPFEGPANIETWANERGHTVTRTRQFLDEPLPGHDEYDWLVIMGGPMSVHDTELYPWLDAEKEFARTSVDAGKTVLGVCLGAQLLACVLGTAVEPCPWKEIGFFPVYLSPCGAGSRVFGALPDEFEAFHWHGETFIIPGGAVTAAETEACMNQAFEYDGRVFGLQFHIEATVESVRLLVENCPGDLADGGPYVQSADAMLGASERTVAMYDTLCRFLDAVAETTSA